MLVCTLHAVTVQYQIRATRWVRNLVFATASLVALSGCALVSVWGDSQVARGLPQVEAQYQNVATVDLHGRYGCGLFVNAFCGAPDWPTAVDAALASYTANGQQPNCFVVHLGLNDALWRLDLVTKNYAAKLDAFLKLFPTQTKVIWINLPFASNPKLPGLDDRLLFINAQLVVAQARFSNLVVIDLRQHFNGHFPQWYDPDGFHYNPVGLQELAATMRSATAAAGCTS